MNALPAALAAAALALPLAASAAEPPPQTRITSYGELVYARPMDSAKDAQADLRRLVIGLERPFDAATELVIELEVEHAVTSADDAGEVAVEQAYVERRLGEVLTARAGLLLVPMGFLNRSHEPTAFLGVNRTLVETAIVPTTWREGALALSAALPGAVTVQAGLTTGFDVGAWDATSPEGQESPLASIHQELQLARTHDASGFLAVDWRGVPGLHVGGSAFAGGVSQGQPGVPRSSLLLWDVHARWSPGKLDLAAMFARGAFSNTRRLNLPLVGNPTLVPEAFDGWYAQAAYRAWEREGMAVTPFARVERVNTGRSYADLGAGLTPAGRPTETVVTAGASLHLSPEVVVKADWQRYEEDGSRTAVNVGLGWAF